MQFLLILAFALLAPVVLVAILVLSEKLWSWVFSRADNESEQPSKLASHLFIAWFFVLVVGMVMMLIVWLPSAAETEVLKHRLFGYRATMLTVSVASPSQLPAVQSFLEPLQTMGQKQIREHQSSRHGSWTDTAEVPVYVKTEASQISLALAHEMGQEQAEIFAALLESLQQMHADDAQHAPWFIHATKQCQMQVQIARRSSFQDGSEWRAALRRVQECMGPRTDALRDAAKLLAGNVRAVTIAQEARFSPWWQRGWKAWWPTQPEDNG